MLDLNLPSTDEKYEAISHLNKKRTGKEKTTLNLFRNIIENTKNNSKDLQLICSKNLSISIRKKKGKHNSYSMNQLGQSMQDFSTLRKPPHSHF
eukprot:snap_masked-scaffold_56-processed-gene-1.25-mRNA-1 protein AED:1.00 eAED:1.00 QI:0/0/0/0/1/1/2/0/93